MLFFVNRWRHESCARRLQAAPEFALRCVDPGSWPTRIRPLRSEAIALRGALAVSFPHRWDVNNRVLHS